MSFHSLLDACLGQDGDDGVSITIRGFDCWAMRTPPPGNVTARLAVFSGPLQSR